MMPKTPSFIYEFQYIEFHIGSKSGDRPDPLNSSTDPAPKTRRITQIRFSDRIFYHEDFYDVGAMIYQHVPVLGRIIRFINQRIGR